MIGTSEFKMIVICILRAETRGNNSSKYYDVQYMHNEGYTYFLKKGRAYYIANKFITGEDIYEDLQCVTIYCSFFMHMNVC